MASGSGSGTTTSLPSTFSSRRRKTSWMRTAKTACCVAVAGRPLRAARPSAPARSGPRLARHRVRPGRHRPDGRTATGGPACRRRTGLRRRPPPRRRRRLGSHRCGTSSGGRRRSSIPRRPASGSALRRRSRGRRGRPASGGRGTAVPPGCEPGSPSRRVRYGRTAMPCSTRCTRRTGLRNPPRGRGRGASPPTTSRSRPPAAAGRPGDQPEAIGPPTRGYRRSSAEILLDPG